MPRYTDDSRERVRDAVDFVEVVGARTELRAAGPRRMTGLCPFHEERTPSFGIDPVEKLYHCFGCGAGGDVFKFVMETESLDFGAALEALAARSGTQLERAQEDPRDAQRRLRRERLLALLDRTATYYVRLLWESAEAASARDYLARRGLEEAVLREFRVGWSPAAWERVLAASRKAGYADEELLAAGLAARRREGPGLLDRFRGRIMFPLADERGRVLGFGARALREEQRPKYLNTSDGELFHKGRIVYGADLARAAAARAGRVALVEGYTDVIALRQAGVPEVVCSMGTALTDHQVDALRRLAPTVLLCQDPDAAGQEAVDKGASALRRFNEGQATRGLEFRVVRLPAGLDPADVVQREGPAALRELLEAAVPIARFEVERALARGELGTPEGRDRVVDALRPILARLPESLLRHDLIAYAAERMQTTAEVLAQLLAQPAAAEPTGGGGTVHQHRPVGRDGGSATSIPPPRQTPWTRAADTEREFLARCLAVKPAGGAALAAADVEVLFSTDLTRRAARYLVANLDSPGQSLPAGDEELARLVAQLVIRSGDLAADRDALELERLQLEKNRLDRAIAEARRAGQPVTALAGERQGVQDEIRHRLV